MSNELPSACDTCGGQKYQVECWNCGGAIYVDHDCGDDTCCCLYPHDNTLCDVCAGKGYHLMCIRCHPEAFNDH